MMLPPEQSLTQAEPAEAGSDLRQRVEGLGTSLAETLGVVLARLPRRWIGPQKLANSLGITQVTASRLLKALAQRDPVAVLQLLPGPNPLRRVLAAARKSGTPHLECDAAEEAVESFDELIHTEAGNRGALKAMLSAWLPEERREFEAERRQSVFKAMCELDGVSSELELSCIILHPGSDPARLDLVNIECMLGIDRIRPDSVVKLGTRYLGRDRGEGGEASAELENDHLRRPTNLDGEPVLEGVHSIRLDGFCEAPPAPLVARQSGGNVEYSLGPTGFGPASRVDLVTAEVNRNEIAFRRRHEGWRSPYFFNIPEMATRRLVFDLVVHQDVYPGSGVELVAYDTAGRGPAVVHDPSRDLDRRQICEEVEVLGSGLQRLRLLEFSRYTELHKLVFEKLDWVLDDFRSYRVTISYPLTGTQISMAFLLPEG